jgi:hypothetical protein
MSQELPKGSGGLPGTAKSQTADRSSLQFEQAPMPPPPSQIIRAEDTENTHPAESNVPFLDSSPIPLTGNANKAINIQPEPSRPTQGAEEMSNNAVLHMRPKSVDNQPRVPEQFHTKQKRTLPKRLTPSVAKQIGIQLGEDDLFELLILKMRDREVNEQKTASIQRQTEIENFSQKAEIRSLYDRLELCQAQLVKSSSETKLQRGQLDKWKVRLNKFKDVINDLGLEYDAVRDQTNDLKSITSSLQKEKADIQQALDDIRLQVAHHTNTIEIQRSKLSNFDGTISMLREALESSDRREETIKLQLAHEKRRVMTLESYIQNESQSQARCLTTVRKTQIEMVEKLEFTCGLFASTCSDSRDAITSTIRPVFEQYVSSVHEFKEQFCVQRRDVEKLTGGIQEATTRYVDLIMI